jgi:GT2 family glycosyltransferase
MSSDGAPLTAAVVHRHVRGYPRDSLRFILPRAPAGSEFLLLCGPEFREERLLEEMPSVRLVRVEGDRAAAKNVAVREARGRRLLLTTSEIFARPEAVPRLMGFLEKRPEAVVSAQLLQENGMRRRTGYALPSVSRELNLMAGLRHFHERVRKGVPPPSGEAVSVPATHAAFLMGATETFRRVGPFREGERFACEDLEWCRRAAGLGVPRLVLPEARAFKMAPQLSGPLPPEVRVGLEAAVWRLVRSTGGRARAAAFRAVRRGESLLKWGGASFLYYATGRRAPFLAAAASAHAGILRLRSADRAPSLPADVESLVRWEMLF